VLKDALIQSYIYRVYFKQKLRLHLGLHLKIYYHKRQYYIVI